MFYSYITFWITSAAISADICINGFPPIKTDECRLQNGVKVPLSPSEGLTWKPDSNWGFTRWIGFFLQSLSIVAAGVVSVGAHTVCVWTAIVSNKKNILPNANKTAPELPGCVVQQQYYLWICLIWTFGSTEPAYVWGPEFGAAPLHTAHVTKSSTRNKGIHVSNKPSRTCVDEITKLSQVQMFFQSPLHLRQMDRGDVFFHHTGLMLVSTRPNNVWNPFPKSLSDISWRGGPTPTSCVQPR